jgi:outer membrane protein OmpA-like peptidoglycan-associated protein
MRTSYSRKLAQRAIAIVSAIAFITLWCVLIFAIRPNIEARLQSETIETISAATQSAPVSVAFRGRDAHISASFETEEERGRFESYVKTIQISGVRKIDHNFSVNQIIERVPDFRLSIRSKDATISGLLKDPATRDQLLAAATMAANGLPVTGEIILADDVAAADWAAPLGQFLPHIAACASNPRIRISDGQLHIAGIAHGQPQKAAIDSALESLLATGLTLKDELTVAEIVIEKEFPSLEIRTYGEKVVVRGLIPLGSGREALLSALQQGTEPGNVEDSLVVKDHVLEAKWLPGIAKLTPILLNTTTEPVISVTQEMITIGGQARDDDARHELESMLQVVATAATLASESQLTIPEPLDPATVTIATTGSALHLKGRLPDEPYHQQLLTAIRRGSADTPLTDESIIGENIALPKWGDAFDKFVTEVLIHSEKGQMQIDNDKLSIEVHVASPDRAEAIELAVKYLDNSGLELLPMKMEIAPAPTPEPEPEPTPVVVEVTPAVETPVPMTPEVAVEELPEPPIANVDPANAASTSPEEEPAAPEIAIVEIPEPPIASVDPAPAKIDMPAKAALTPPPFLSDYTIYFGHGTALLKSGDITRLRTMAAILKQHAGENYVVAAFSDSSGDLEFNEWLRGKRADAVRKKLVEMGIKADSLSTKGFGSLGPKGAAKNDPRLREFRRVEILMVAKSNPVTGTEKRPSTTADARSLASLPTSAETDPSKLLASLEDTRIYARAVASAGRHTFSVSTSDTPAPMIRDEDFGQEIKIFPEDVVPRALPVLIERPEPIGHINFEHGTAMLKADSLLAIDKIAEQLKTSKSDAPYEITGYADPIGDPAFNQWLSEERAKSVLEALRKKGIPADRLRIRTHSKAGLIADPTTEEGLRQNRRVEIYPGI